jgi:hypothetical protein
MNDIELLEKLLTEHQDKTVKVLVLKLSARNKCQQKSSDHSA